MKLEDVAIHEAGHMVIGCYYNLSPKNVTIVENSDSLGHVLMKSYCKRFFTACECGSLSPYMADRLDKILQTTLAGGLAEKRQTGRWNNAGCRSDREQVISLGGFRYPWGSKSFNIYTKLMHSAAEDMVNCRWREIEAVKKALLDHEMLTLQQVKAVINECVVGGSRGSL